MSYKILDGKKISEKKLLKIAKKIKTLKTTPILAVIFVGNNSASEIFINLKEKACKKVSIKTQLHHYTKTNTKHLIKLIQELNNNKQITGIMVQLPLPKNIDKEKVLSEISFEKDVDGLNINYFGKILNSDYGPCTPTGIMELLSNYKIKIAKKNVCIINHSNLIGKPLALMMLKKDATVTICHDKTNNLKEHTRIADIIITAAGVPNLINSSHVKKGAIIIDAGVKKIKDKIYGDVNFESVKNKVSYITPVPGGVGPMTIASLIENISKVKIK